ncbi:unnamed protein product [Trifolium pratense]|uniref:Uncharacterized protein n=1 Tax=Trifolium pratense TaxID=57577 RepID=A0ACB0KZZ0_TRIPR|nr:unnamed protein product [Trifolium pratense]
MTRHLSFSKFNDPVHEKCDVFGRAKHLRTLFAINFISPPPFNNEKIACTILSNLKCLRVLSLRNFRGLVEVPDSIDELIHLHYLNLTWTHIKSLPESLCNLYNLQTLKLQNCMSLTRLPNDMQNLVSLCHLDISGCYELEVTPREMSKLIHLQHLSNYDVGTHKDNGIKELGTLSNLHGSLSIKKLENVINSSEASATKIMDKKYLEKLCLSWSEDVKDHFTNSQSEMDILDKLQPTKNLKRLEDLAIRRMSMLETIGYEYGDSFSQTLFPSLEYLEFNDMPCWKMWHHSRVSEDSFPVLKSLVILDCPKLEGDLSSHLPVLETIKIERCNQLGSSLPKASSIRKLCITESNKVVVHELPLSLEELRIHGREVTNSAFEAIDITLLTSLQTFDINDCSSVILWEIVYPHP